MKHNAVALVYHWKYFRAVGNKMKRVVCTILSHNLPRDAYLEPLQLFRVKIMFLHDRPWISPWLKSISSVLDITCHVFASQLSGHCDVIANRLWRHQQNVKRASETRGWCVKILVLASLMDSLCRVRNKIMYALLWRTVYTLTRVLFWCLFPSLLRNSGNKHQINTLVSTYTVCHPSTYIILYLIRKAVKLNLPGS